MIINNIKQNWKIKINNKNKQFPYLIIDNWYTKEEEKYVWKELNFWTDILKKNKAEKEKEIFAKDKNGKSLGSHSRVYLNDLYSNIGINSSPISKCLYKQRDSKFHELLLKISPVFRNFSTTNKNTSFFSYYEKDDYYDCHFDMCFFTCLIWFHYIPKAYEGGNFYLTECEDEIISKHNRMIIFPSFMLHKVSPIKIKKKLDLSNFGRYTITHFYTYEFI